MTPVAPKRRRAVWEPAALVAKVLHECQLIHLALTNVVRGAVSSPGHAMDTGAGKAPRKAAGESRTQEPLEPNAFDGSSGADRTFGSRDHGKDPRTEGQAVYARVGIREHLSAKFNQKTWTFPTPTPTVDPHGFDDPISDAFWKKVWIACAVHNVSLCARGLLTTAEIPFRRKSIARYSTLSPTISSPPGSSTRISYSTTNV